MAATEIVAALIRKQWKITTAESCTGGLLAAAITEVSGASTIFDQGIISYANAAKTMLLGVDAATLAQHGAVSEAVATQMAEGARTRAKADVAVAITGIAGPAGGSAEKPVGLVWIAVSMVGNTHARSYHFSGDRHAVRMQAVDASLSWLQNILT